MTATGGGRVHVSSQGPVARVVLSNPGKFNAMSRAMWRELRTVFDHLQHRSDVRCVVVSGEGGHFCAGGDIAEYPDFRFESESLRQFHEQDVWGGLQAMLQCDVPLVAQIEGNCMGAGVEIASACDIRLAGRSARLGAPIAKLGFPMAPREAQLVVRQLGLPMTRAMLLEAAVFTADEMAANGFLREVMDDADLDLEAQLRAQRIAALAPQAARMNKQSLRQLVELQRAPLPQAWLDGAFAYADSAEHQEGVAAFMAKRPPVF